MTINRFRGAYGFLSNFYDCEPFEYKGVWYSNVEAFYQAQKCFDEEDKKQFEGLSGVAAKSLSKEIFIREDWDEISERVMRYGLRQKFKDPRLKALLLKTGDATIAEGNLHGDTFWGYCLKTLKGKNKLGLLLMRLRQELRTSSNVKKK